MEKKVDILSSAISYFIFKLVKVKHTLFRKLLIYLCIYEAQIMYIYKYEIHLKIYSHVNDVSVIK